MNIQDLMGSASGGATTAGAMSMSDIEDLKKAMTAGYGTDSNTFTGQAAFRIQSLDTTMKSTVQQNEDFVLFNKLQKLNATATVDEWTERSSIGGFLGGTTNSEVGNIATQNGKYARNTAQVKYLMTQCQVSFVSTLGKNMEPIEAVENEAGALRLLTDAEYLSFYGDSAVNPFEFDGIFTQLQHAVDSGYMDGTHVIDVNGGSLTDITKFNGGAATIRGMGNFGKATDLFCSFSTQADLDASLDPAWRVALTGMGGDQLKIGSPVVGIRTSFGDIATQKDVFVLDEPMLIPFEANTDTAVANIAVSNASLAPASVTYAAASNPASTFTAPRAGNYYYLVCGLNQLGQSTGVVSAVQAISAGQAVTLTITRSAGAQETGYAIYRTAQNGAKGTNNAGFRLMARIPVAGATTTYVDANQNIAGAVKAAMVSMKPGADNISWRQLLPMTKFQLYPTQAAILPWAQMLFGYLRIAKRKQNVLYKNIVPTNAVFQPFVAGA